MTSRLLPAMTLMRVLAALGIAACNAAEPMSTEAQDPSETMRDGATADADVMTDLLGAGCPTVVPGTDVTVADTEGGVSLTFSTHTGDVADLRTRAQHMTQMYDMHRGRSGMMWHAMGGGGHGGPGMGDGGMDHRGGGMGTPDGRGAMPATHATMSDTDSGALLELTPHDASQLDTLRDHIRSHRERMHSGECWTLQDLPDADEASGGDGG